MTDDKHVLPFNIRAPHPLTEKKVEKRKVLLGM